MASRAIWKGFLSVGALTCGVALHAATSASERISLHMVSRKTGGRLRRQYVDAETGQPVESDSQVKGYEVATGEYIVIEPEEIADMVPENTKTITVDAFLPCAEIDEAYLDRPYFLSPADAASAEAFDLIAAGMAEKKVAALGEALLFRRLRRLLIRPGADGTLIAETLNFDYEVRRAEEVFADIPKVKVTGEMLKLATHIIGTKKGKFDPSAFDDRYEAALAELVKAKLEGRKIPPPKKAPRGKVVDLMAALRESANLKDEPAGKTAAASKRTPKKAAAKKPAMPHRKAG